MRLQSVYEEIDRRRKTYLQDLRRLLQQPSVSPQGIGVEECAHLVADSFERIGCQRVEVVPTKGNPIVYGRYDAGAPTAKTLIVYMMYDTQPYEEPGWTHDPMGASLVPMELPSGGVTALINRGAVNSKGPLMAFLHALEAVRAVEGELPLNVVLIAEGEEELGSPNLPEFVRARKEELAQADACFFPFFLQDQYGKPRLYLGNKGIVYFELECSGRAWGRGPEEFDVHSSHKAWLDSPVWRLLHALCSLTDKTGNRVLIKGFYDDVAVPTPEEEGLIQKLAETFDPQAIKEMTKASSFLVDGANCEELLRTYLCSPTLNVDGIWGGYTGPGSKTVLPHKATAKIDIRLVPNQDPQKMIRWMREHLDSQGYRDIEMTTLDAYPWAQTDPEAPVVQAVLQACEDFGHEAEIWPRIGGSAPFYLFTQELEVPFTMGVLGHGGRAHSPDEYIVWEGNERVVGYDGAVKSIAAFLERYASAKGWKNSDDPLEM